MSGEESWKETEIGRIPKDWEVKIADEVKSNEKKAIISGPFGSNIGRKYFVDSGIPVIRGNNLTTDMSRFIDDGFVFVTPEKAKELNTWAKRNDIIFTAAGTLGQVGIIEENSKHENYIISNKQLRLRVNEQIILPLFAFYWFSSPKMVKYIEQRNTGSTIPLINLSILRSLPVPLPPLPEQQAIAHILGTLDDRIELNRKMNRTLEQIGQAIFKHWFVDFEFPNEEGKPYKSSGGEMVDSELGEIPKGWRVEPLDKIADFLNGLALQKYPPKDENYLPVIKIRELKQGVTTSSDKASHEIDEKYIIDDSDLIFSWSGSLEVVIWCGGKGALNQHLFKVTSEKHPKWFIHQWLLQNLPWFRHIAAGKATTMGHIKRHHLSDTLIVIPIKEVMENADCMLKPILEKFVKSSIGIRNLAELRDSLLPKLMSGKIRVNFSNKEATNEIMG